jgi:enamine deaminase RidA (YjgF/YER057c/UK114 family)
MSFEARLAELGIELPTPPAPVASYVPTVVSGSHIWVSGQVPFRDGAVAHPGLVGSDVSQEDAADEARVCAINALSQLQAALGSLDRIARIVKVQVFVASAPGFAAQPLVANGASDLFVEVFGEAGRHARSAVGVAMLPLNVPVEVDLVAEIRPA